MSELPLLAKSYLKNVLDWDSEDTDMDLENIADSMADLEDPSSALKVSGPDPDISMENPASLRYVAMRSPFFPSDTSDLVLE